MLLTKSTYFTSIIVASVGTDSTQAVYVNWIVLSKGKQELGTDETEMKNVINQVEFSVKINLFVHLQH